jgi:Choline/ethanolamine kinase
MNLDKSRTFQYVKIENDGTRYFCLQQNPVILAWILCFKPNTLRPIIWPYSKRLSLRFLVAWLRNIYTLLRKNFTFLLVFTRYKYQLRQIASVVILPVYGQICVPVHKGYKIFDLRRAVVIKVFDRDINTSTIADEIEQLKTVSQIDFAPSLKKWNIEERWYEEDYVSGTLADPDKPLETGVLLKHFQEVLVPKLNALLLFKKPKSTHALEYVNNLQKVLEVSRLAQRESTLREFAKIKSFFDSTVGHLKAGGNYQITLVFTHGDFCPANMLTTRHGLKLIDWENATYRSAMFDFYSYFFYRPVCRNVPVSKTVLEISQALPLFISTLPKKEAAISTNLIHMEQLYRWIYYMEQICQDVKREMTDKRLNILGFILRYIEAFHCYDEMIASKTQLNTASPK